MSNGLIDDKLEQHSRWAPWVIVGYFVVQLIVRLLISSKLEVDDAEMVGQVYWALGYPNSHPPLYHWVVRVCYEIFHYWPAATVVPRYALLAATYLLVYDTGRRITGSAITGAVAAACLFFVPVVCWKSHGKLTHSVLGIMATAALLHAIILLLVRPKTWMFVWLGLVLTIGTLAKYNFLLVAGAAGIAILCVTDLRGRFADRRALICVILPAALTLPHWLWVWSNPASLTENRYRLHITGGPLGLHFGINSVWNGLISLFLMIAISAGPMLLFYLSAQLVCRKDTSGTHPDQTMIVRTMQRFLGWMVLMEIALCVVVIFVGDVWQVHERYLLVLVPPLPLYVSLRLQADKHPCLARLTFAAAIALALFITIARPISLKSDEQSLTPAPKTAEN